MFSGLGGDEGTPNFLVFPFTMVHGITEWSLSQCAVGSSPDWLASSTTNCFVFSFFKWPHNFLSFTGYISQVHLICCHFLLVHPSIQSTVLNPQAIVVQNRFCRVRVYSGGSLQPATAGGLTTGLCNLSHLIKRKKCTWNNRI